MHMHMRMGMYEHVHVTPPSRLPSTVRPVAGSKGHATPSELALRMAVWWIYLLLVGAGVVCFRGSEP